MVIIVLCIVTCITYPGVELLRHLRHRAPNSFTCAILHRTTPPLLRQTRLSAPACATEPALSREAWPPWSSVPENLAEIVFSVSIRVWFRFHRTMNGYGSWLLLRCNAAGTMRLFRLSFSFSCATFARFVCRRRPLHSNLLKMNKMERNVFESHCKHIE